MPDTDQAPPPTYTLPVWHHRDFIAATAGPDGTLYRFREFYRYSKAPEIPDEIIGTLNRARRDGHPDVETWWKQITDEVYAARRAWARDMHRSHLTEDLRKLAAVWPKYQAARKLADDAYAALERTPDGFWRTAILSLVTHRQAARDLAEQADQHARNIADMDREYRKVYPDLPDWRTYATTTEALTVSGWTLCEWDDYHRSAWGSGTGNPTLDELNDTIEQQDKLITAAADLTGGSDAGR